MIPKSMWRTQKKTATFEVLVKYFTCIPENWKITSIKKKGLLV